MKYNFIEKNGIIELIVENYNGIGGGRSSNLNHKRKILLEITENKEEFSWEELNCFFRPWSIMYKGVSEQFYDLFLFDTLFYYNFVIDNLFSKGKTYYLKEDEFFLEFANKNLDYKYKVKTEKILVSSYEAFIEKIMKSIDDDIMILIPADLIELNYFAGYKEYSAGHFFLLKGYDYNKNLFYILDNMHINGGASIVYKDFVINFKKLYELNQLFFKNIFYNKKPYIWSLQRKLEDYPQINIYKVLKEHKEVLNDMNTIKIKYANDILDIVEKNQCNDEEIIIKLLRKSNSKSVYYKILQRFLNSFYDEKLVDLESEIQKNLKTWKNLISRLLYQFQKGTSNYCLLNNQLKEQLNDDYLLRKRIIELIDGISTREKNHLIDNQFLKNAKLLNHHEAEIKFNNGVFTIIHSPDRTYDTWLSQDNAVQLLFTNFKEKTVLDCKVQIRESMGSTFHTGIIVKCKDGSKILYGLYSGLQLTIFIPERGDDYQVYNERYIGDKVYLRVVLEDNVCSFFFKEKYDDHWKDTDSISIEKMVKSIGLFSKTWEGCQFISNFSDIKFSQ